MMGIINIGGEFDINPFELTDYPTFTLKQPFLLSSGRSALMFILKHLYNQSKRVIHLPYYICESVVNSCFNSKFEIVFYELDANYQFPIELLENIETNEVLLVVNYFGFVNNNSVLEKVKQLRPDITTISDEVQSYWAYPNIIADYSYTSLRKHFPIPEGGLVHSNKQIDLSIISHFSDSTFYKNKILGAILKHQKVPDSLYLTLFNEGEMEIDNDCEITKASKLSHYLYGRLNFTEAQQKRKENYKLVSEIGIKSNIDFMFKYDEAAIPLCVPILIKDRDKLRKKLMRENIFLPVHWPIKHFNKKSSLAGRLANCEMSIVIDQRYTTEEIIFQIEQIKNLLK